MSKRMISDVYSVCWTPPSSEPKRALRKATSRLGRLRVPSLTYYDPYQTEQVQADTPEHSVRKRHRPMSVLQRLKPLVMYSTALCLSAYDYFVSDVAFLGEKKKPAMRGFGVDFAPFFRPPEEKRHLGCPSHPSDTDWGYIEKDLHVHFMSSGTPPPKPKRTLQYHYHE